MPLIHPAAFVDPAAEIADDVKVGPFSIIEAGTKIGSGTEIAGHVAIKTGVTLGKNNTITEGVVLGGRPQHLAAGEQVGRLEIGDNNTIREYATIHLGLTSTNCTRVGSNNLVMAYAHIGHDSQVADHVIIANNVMVAGHVTIEDRAYLSGAVGIHQFCRVGQLAMVGGQCHVSQDIPPFVTVDGISNHVVGLNRVGLRRAGYSKSQVAELKAAYRTIYRSDLAWDAVLKKLKADYTEGPAADFHRFFLQSTRGIVQERRSPRNATLKIFTGDEADNKATRQAG